MVIAIYCGWRSGKKGEGTLTPLIILIRPAELVHDLYAKLIEHLLVQIPDLAIPRQLGNTHSERDVGRRVADYQPCQFGREGVGSLRVS